MRVGRKAVLKALVLSLAAAGMPVYAANHIVEARSNMTFVPATLTIAPGDTVTFRNGSGAGTHNARSDPSQVTNFRSGNLSSGPWTITVTFPTAGTVRFYCEAHGAPGGVGMAGVITIAGGTTAVAKRSDFNADAHSDILWRNNSSGANTIWRSGNSATTQALPAIALAWRMVGVGDYNGDAASDILWRNVNSGANTIWRSGNSSTLQAVTGVTAQTWVIAASGDYNGDGNADIFWRNSNTGANVIWRSANSTMQTAVPTIPTVWHIVGSGDYNGDGNADILWRNSGNGANSIWRSGNPATPQAMTAVPNQAWTVVGMPE